jgi:hypothetical protein
LSLKTDFAARRSAQPPSERVARCGGESAGAAGIRGNRNCGRKPQPRGYSKILPRLKRQIAMDMTVAVMPPRIPRMGRICVRPMPAQRTELKPSIDQ